MTEEKKIQDSNQGQEESQGLAEARQSGEPSDESTVVRSKKRGRLSFPSFYLGSSDGGASSYSEDFANRARMPRNPQWSILWRVRRRQRGQGAHREGVFWIVSLICTLWSKLLYCAVYA